VKRVRKESKLRNGEGKGRENKRIKDSGERTKAVKNKPRQK
jgi:hypothetical protein